MPGEVLPIAGLAVLGGLLGATVVPWWAHAEVHAEARLGVPGRIAAAIATAAAFGLLAWRIGLEWMLPAALALAAAGAAIAVVDLLERRIPNRMLLVAAPVVGALLVGGAAITGDWWSIVWAAAGAAAMFAVYLVIALASPSAMGMGDVKLAAVLGGVLGAAGWSTWVVGLFAAFLVGGIAALAALVAGRVGWRGSIPFGPWMVVGTVVGLAI